MGVWRGFELKNVKQKNRSESQSPENFKKGEKGRYARRGGLFLLKGTGGEKGADFESKRCTKITQHRRRLQGLLEKKKGKQFFHDHQRTGLGKPGLSSKQLKKQRQI